MQPYGCRSDARASDACKYDGRVSHREMPRRFRAKAPRASSPRPASIDVGHIAPPIAYRFLRIAEIISHGGAEVVAADRPLPLLIDARLRRGELVAALQSWPSIASRRAHGRVVFTYSNDMRSSHAK